MEPFYQYVSCVKDRDCQTTLVNFVETSIVSFIISYLWTSKKRKTEVEIEAETICYCIY